MLDQRRVKLQSWAWFLRGFIWMCRPALPSRLQLPELQQLLGACEALSFLAESAGARPVLTLRNAIQVRPLAILYL